jgi:hypothetical protein
MTYWSVPTLLTLGNVRVAIHSNDHPPPHVHAIGRDGARARFELTCPDGPVRLMEQAGFRPAEITRIGGAVAAELEAICAKWREIHG